MFKSNKRPVRGEKQRGYTAIELGAAIAGGLIFIAAATFGILRAMDNNRYSTLISQATSAAPQALMAVYTNNGTLFRGLTNDPAVARTGVVNAGLKGETPWNLPFVVSAAPAAGNPNVITIDYPVSGAQADVKAPTIAAQIVDSDGVGADGMITAAVYDAANDLISVTYNLTN